MFILDKLVLRFIKSLLESSYMQFAALTSLWVVAEIVYPCNKKVRK